MLPRLCCLKTLLTDIRWLEPEYLLEWCHFIWIRMRGWSWVVRWLLLHSLAPNCPDCCLSLFGSDRWLVHTRSFFQKQVACCIAGTKGEGWGGRTQEDHYWYYAVWTAGSLPAFRSYCQPRRITHARPQGRPELQVSVLWQVYCVVYIELYTQEKKLEAQAGEDV